MGFNDMCRGKKVKKLKKAFVSVFVLSLICAACLFAAGCGKQADITADDIHITYKVTELDINDYASASANGKAEEVTADLSGVQFGIPGVYPVTISAGDSSVEKNVYIYGEPQITGSAVIVLSWKDAGNETALKAGLSAQDTFGNPLDITVDEGITAGEYGRYGGEYMLSFSAVDRAGQTAVFLRTAEVQTDAVTLGTVMCYTDSSEISVPLEGNSLQSVWYADGTQAPASAYSVEEGALVLGGEMIASFAAGHNVLYMNFAEGYCTLDILAGDPSAEYVISAPERINVRCGETDYNFLTGVTASLNGVSAYPVTADLGAMDLSVAGQYSVTYRAGVTEKTVPVYVYGDIRVTGGGTTVNAPWYDVEEAAFGNMSATDFFGEELEPVMTAGIPASAYIEHDRVQPGEYQITFTATDAVGNTADITYTVNVLADTLSLAGINVDLLDLSAESLGSLTADTLIAIYDDGGALAENTDYFIENGKISFSESYISPLIGGEAPALYLNFESGYADTVLNITDEKAPAFTMSHSLDGKYYLTGEAVPIPTAEKTAGSLQQLSFVYKLDGEEFTGGAATFEQAGRHTFTAEIWRGGSALADYTVEETFNSADFAALLANGTDFADEGYGFLYSTAQNLEFAGDTADKSGTVKTALYYSMPTANVNNSMPNFLRFNGTVLDMAKAAGFAYLTFKIYIPHDTETASNNGYLTATPNADGVNYTLVYYTGGSKENPAAANWLTVQAELASLAEGQDFMIAPRGREMYIAEVRFTGGAGQLAAALASGANFAAEDMSEFNLLTSSKLSEGKTTRTYEEVTDAKDVTQNAMVYTVNATSIDGSYYLYFNMDIINAAIEAGYTDIRFTAYGTKASDVFSLYLNGTLKQYNVGGSGWTEYTFALADFGSDSTENYFYPGGATIAFSSVTFIK